MIIAQLSDPHIVAPGKSPRYASRTGPDRHRGALGARGRGDSIALDPRPDIAVIDRRPRRSAASPTNTTICVDLLAPLRMPVFVIPGNHDAREPLRAAFARRRISAARRLPALCDRGLSAAARSRSTRLSRAKHGGALCAERLRLARSHARAAQPNRPTLVMMHHPPFATGIAHMDRDRLRRRRRVRRDHRAAIRRSSASSAAICIARSTAASPARSPGPRRARRTRSRSTSAPRRGSASPSSRPAISCICGATAVSSPTPRFSATGPGRTRCAPKPRRAYPGADPRADPARRFASRSGSA